MQITLRPYLGLTSRLETLQEWDLGYNFVCIGASQFTGSSISKADVKFLNEAGISHITFEYADSTGEKHISHEVSLCP